MSSFEERYGPWICMGCGMAHALGAPCPPTFANAEPLARDSDLETSHLAGEKLTKSGKRSSWKMRILIWMQENGIDTVTASLTSRELAERSGIKHECCHKRLADLERDGHVVKGKQRECRVTHEQAWTWMTRTDFTEREEIMAGNFKEETNDD